MREFKLNDLRELSSEEQLALEGGTASSSSCSKCTCTCRCEGKVSTATADSTADDCTSEVKSSLSKRKR